MRIFVVFFLFSIIGSNIILAQDHNVNQKIDSLIKIVNVVDAYQDKGEKEMLLICTEIYYQSKEAGYKKGMLKALVSFGRIYTLNMQNNGSNYQEGLDKISEGLLLAEELEDYESQAYLLYYKSLSLSNIQYKDQAIELLDKALILSDKILDNNKKYKVRASIYKGYFTIYFRSKSNQTAIKYAKLIHDEAQKISEKDPEKLGFLLSGVLGLGNVYLLEKKYDEAEKYLKNAEFLQMKMKNQRYLVVIYINLAYIREMQNRNKEAIDYNLEAIYFIKKYNTPSYLPAVYYSLAEVYAKNQDYKNEALYLKKNKSLTDSLNAAEKKAIRDTAKRLISEKKSYFPEILYYTLSGLFVLICSVAIALFIRKKKIPAKIKQEIVSDNNSNKAPETITRVVNLKDNEPTAKELEELYQLAFENNLAFIQKFRYHFPIFYKNITTTYPNWTSNELEVCLLLKLNFSTKEIAQITNSSIRSIESKKYRIRKKMEIPSQQDISVWLNNSPF